MIHNDYSFWTLLMIAILFSSIVLYTAENNALALSEGDRIRNDYCNFKKQQDLNYDCEIITEFNPSTTYKSIPKTQTNNNPIKSSIIEPSNENEDDGIVSGFMIVIFLIVAPIVFRQVWKNHSRMENSSKNRGKNNGSYFTSEQNRQEEQRRYEQFRQEQEAKDEERKREEKFWQEE